MKAVLKIAEKQRKTKAGLKQIFNYITREDALYKSYGIGVSDNKEIAFKAFMLNKNLWGKNKDKINRFCQHEILSFESGTDPELVKEIVLEYCKRSYQNKNFNSFFAIHIDTNNIHAHILSDNVNFENGMMMQTLTEKQYNKNLRKQGKEEVFVYEEKRRLFDKICNEKGYEISLEESYDFLHQKKIEDGRVWKTQKQIKEFDKKNSWRNIIKNRLEEIYKRADLTEDNIEDIAKEYNLFITRHNKIEKTITFALGSLETKEKIKLERLMEQEQERFDNKEDNIFNYKNFFRDRTLEKNFLETLVAFEKKADEEIEKELKLEQEYIKTLGKEEVKEVKKEVEDKKDPFKNFFHNKRELTEEENKNIKELIKNIYIKNNDDFEKKLEITQPAKLEVEEEEETNEEEKEIIEVKKEVASSETNFKEKLYKKIEKKGDMNVLQFNNFLEDSRDEDNTEFIDFLLKNTSEFVENIDGYKTISAENFREKVEKIVENEEVIDDLSKVIKNEKNKEKEYE